MLRFNPQEDDLFIYFSSFLLDTTIGVLLATDSTSQLPIIYSLDSEGDAYLKINSQTGRLSNTVVLDTEVSYYELGQRNVLKRARFQG